MNKEPASPRSRDDASPEKEMSFWEHLEELRMTLFACLLAFVGSAVGALVFYKEIFSLLRLPLERAGDASGAMQNALTSMHFTDPFSILLYIGILGGIVLSGPFVLYKLGRFVAPALSQREQRRLVPICLSASVLFIAGALLAFVEIAPISIEFMYFFSSEMGLQVNWLAADYYAFIVILVLFVGLLFEFPLLITALIYFEIIAPRALLKQWRWVVSGILVAIAFVSPVGDPITLLALTGLLFLLFLCAVFVGDCLLKRKLAARAADEAAFDAKFAAATPQKHPEPSSTQATPVTDDENGDLRILD
ncbi:MAG: twin-arginine translocase subunit TatC [Opitutales bacterium]|nr:twin-arginine translocase subunit TatC [Opitutales bacterium]